MTGCLRCELAEVHDRFGFALDHRDVDAWLGVFADDAVYDNGRSVLRGHDELAAWFEGRSLTRTTRHVWGGLVVTGSDTDRVDARSVWTCYAANEAPPVERVAIWSVADFTDTFVRRDDRWLIAHRTIRHVFRDPSVAP